MMVCRLANASFISSGGYGMRYIVEENVHEAIDPDKQIRIVDTEDESYVSVTDLLCRLPVDLVMQVEYVFSVN
uniref:Uncharacterized protein n=1 Tax=Leviviridae sp. TaxID=2027243 RepID=A0A514D4X9_9VIRU|nr:MAG: hypothetical protein H2Bulk364288_000002 [Leviviridae sp.]